MSDEIDEIDEDQHGWRRHGWHGECFPGVVKRLVISSRAGAEAQLRAHPPGTFTHILSIGSPNEDAIAGWDEAGCAHGLRLAFDDVTYDPLFAVRYGYTPPCREHVERIIAWARAATPDSAVLIHCYAGISRSTAAGIIALRARGLTETAAEKLIEYAQPRMIPNRLMLKFANELLR